MLNMHKIDGEQQQQPILSEPEQDGMRLEIDDRFGPFEARNRSTLPKMNH